MLTNLQRARRRFNFRFAVTIAVTGFIVFGTALSLLRPIILEDLENRVLENLLIPVVEETVTAVQGEPPVSTDFQTRPGWLRIRAVLKDRELELGEFSLRAPSLIRSSVIISLLCCIIGVTSVMVFALPWTRRLQRVATAFGAVGKSGPTSKIDVEEDDVVGHIAHGFNDMVDRIESSLEEREELIQAVSHELATPLARLRLLLSLGDQIDRGAIRHELTELESLAEELVAYVEEDVPRDESTCDAVDVVRQTVETHRNWTRRDLALECEIPSAFVTGDERSLDRCLSNLLRNAERHAERAVQVVLRASADRVRIEVHDDGIGVPTEQRERIFLPFARANAGRDRESGGVGLGLALVGRIVERHGGNVRVEDSPLGGAKFVVDWPRVSESSARGVPEESQVALGEYEQ